MGSAEITLGDTSYHGGEYARSQGKRIITAYLGKAALSSIQGRQE
jgi:hypothetical protein